MLFRIALEMSVFIIGGMAFLPQVPTVVFMIELQIPALVTMSTYVYDDPFVGCVRYAIEGTATAYEAIFTAING
jgi:hypothetical protein